MNRRLISCEQHDYVEIACLYQLEIEVTTNNLEIFRGVAGDIAQKDRAEYLLLLTPEIIEIDLTGIRSLRALKSNAHFSEVRF